MIERLALIDSVTAQLLQVHSHALGIVARLAGDEQRRQLLPEIVEHGKLLASVGSEAKPSGKLADIARTELEELPGGSYRLTCQKYFASLAPAADELLIWTAVPGEGPYQERSIIALVPREAPEVELIDQWDVLGMRATVSHSVRITGYEVPAHRLIGEPGAWTRRDPRTFTLAFAANHIGAAGAALEFATEWVRERPGLAGSEVTRVALGTLSSGLFAARCALYAGGGSVGRGRLRRGRTRVDPRAAHRQARRTRHDPAGVRHLRGARRVSQLRARAAVPRRAHILAALPRRAVHAPGRPGDARWGLPSQGVRRRVDVPAGAGVAASWLRGVVGDNWAHLHRNIPRARLVATAAQSHG